MSRVEELYRWLARDTQPGANEVLGAALAHAEPEYATRIAEILIARRHETAWAGLVAHLERLDVDQQDRVLARPELVRAGLAVALRSPATSTRLSALQVASQYAAPTLAYLMAERLRDENSAVRTLAAQALRYTAGCVLDGGTTVTAADRTELVRGLGEALRSFPRHQQLPVLEAGLWLTVDLGDTLWDALADQPSRCGQIVDQHLKHWDNPRLAGFLLMGLARPAWRRTAQQMLGAWHTRDQIIALLRHSALLQHPLVGRELQMLQRPRWFLEAIAQLDDLPAELRAQMPHWVCRLGFTTTERVRCLQYWQTSRRPELQRASVYALAALDTPESDGLLMHVAQRPGPLLRFARWYIAGRQLTAASAKPERTEEATPQPARAGGGRV
jgi:hypothetical protein